MTLTNSSEEANVPAKIAGFGMIAAGAVSAVAMLPWTWMGAEQVLLLGGWCALMVGGGWALARSGDRSAPTHG